MKPDTRDTNIEFRCPQCFKLYKTSASDIYSSQPQFECASCHAQFVFDYPPRNNKAIYTKALSLPQVSKLAKSNAKPGRSEKSAKVESAKTGELKVCPKCQATNPRGITECYRCGVVFAKYEAMQLEKQMEKTEKLEDSRVDAKKNPPSLIKMWQDLMGDYTNMAKHLAFVDRCEELHALPFALKKYNDLKEVQPQDSLAHQMLNSVLVKSFSRQAQGVAALPWIAGYLRFMKNIPWTNLLRVSPLALALLLIGIGLIGHGNRNLAGGGVALLVLILGFTYFMKGRIHWRHFWP